MSLELLAGECFVFAKLLTYPTKELKEELLQVISQLSEDRFQVKHTLTLIKDEALEVLQGEYTSLFITGYPKTPCPPYFSAYQTGMIISDYTDKLYAMYESYGIELSNEQFPDFIPTMMEFMTLLLANGLKEDARAFYKEYLAWISEFSKNIKRNTNNEYFIKISDQLTQFIGDVDDFFKE